MLNSIKTEIKTLVRMKSVWICAVVLLVVSLLYVNLNYNTVETEISYLKLIVEEMHGMTGDDGSVDTSSIEETLCEIYKTYNPKMSVNNNMGVLLGLGLIVFPIISALYMGIEYSRNKAIKYKTAHESLFKVFLSKIIVVFIYVVVLVSVYTIIGHIVASMRWRGLFESLSSIDFVDYTTITFNTLTKNMAIIIFAIGVFVFYSLVSMLVGALTKSGTYGMISVIVINYVVIPSSYSPHNVIFSIINNLFYTSSVSPYEFVQSGVGPLEFVNAGLFFAGYMLLVNFALLLLGKTQKNT